MEEVVVGRMGKSGMLTTSDVAGLVNVHINTVRRWSNEGTLRVYRIGSRGDRRFRQEDIDSFLSQGSKDIRRKGKPPFEMRIKLPSNDKR